MTVLWIITTFFPIIERIGQAVAGTLHNVLYGKLDVEFHESLLDNEELLGRVASKNRRTNGRGGRRGRTYLLSQVTPTELRCTPTEGG